MTDFVRCRSCGAEIVWTVTDATGKRMPVDAKPADDGNLALIYPDNGRGPVVSIAHGSIAAKVPPPRYKSHFATCANAAQHRRAR